MAITMDDVLTEIRALAREVEQLRQAKARPSNASTPSRRRASSGAPDDMPEARRSEGVGKAKMYQLLSDEDAPMRAVNIGGSTFITEAEIRNYEKLRERRN